MTAKGFICRRPGVSLRRQLSPILTDLENDFMAKTKNKDTKISPRYVQTGHEDISDNFTQITAQERKMLRNVNSTDARWLYIELSFFRDFETGIAGLNPKLSSSTLRQTISHKSDIGVKEKRLSNNHIQRWIDQLQYAGLIENRGNHVYYLPLAPKYPRKEKISNSFCNSFEEKGVTVTKAVTNSLSNDDKTSINAAQNNDSEVLQNVLQNNELSQVNTNKASHILLPIQNNNYTKLNYTIPANFLTAEENKFINLFTDLKLNVKLAGDLKAITTAKALSKAGVTLEQASEALKIKLNGYKGDRTPHPSYFLQAILDYKKELDAINEPETPKNERNAPTTRYKPRRITHEQRSKRMAEWAEKYPKELEQEDEGP